MPLNCLVRQSTLGEQNWATETLCRAQASSTACLSVSNSRPVNLRRLISMIWPKPLVRPGFLICVSWLDDNDDEHTNGIGSGCDRTGAGSGGCEIEWDFIFVFCFRLSILSNVFLFSVVMLVELELFLLLVFL